MSGKQARKLRKSLGMKTTNHTEKDHKLINEVKKAAYFKNSEGEVTPVMTERGQIINTNLNFYRKQKKLLKKGM